VIFNLSLKDQWLSAQHNWSAGKGNKQKDY